MGLSLNKLVFQPPPTSYSNNSNLLWLSTSRNQLIAAFHIFLSESYPTILFSHGNAEDLGIIVNFLREAACIWRVNILAYEYSGYGLSSGTPSEANIYSDAEAAYNYLVKDFQVPSSSIIVYGRSLGSGPSIHLAAKFPVRGLIIQSGILSVHRVAINLRITLPGDMFCNIDKIANVQCPVFFIHGVKDQIVPISHGMQLYNECTNAVSPYWIEEASHNNIESVAGIEFFENVSRFLSFLESEPIPSPAVAEKKKRNI